MIKNVEVKLSMKNFTLIIFSIILPLFVNGQARVIQGKVVALSTGEPLGGLIIEIEKINISSTTSKNGYFKLAVPDTLKELNFSIAGYHIDKIKQNGDYYQLFVTQDIFSLTLPDLINLQVISSSKKKENLLLSPADVELYPQRTMEVLNYNRLIDYLEFATGMSSVNGEGNFFYTTTIRGNTRVNYNTNTLLLYNGIMIYNPYHGSFDFQAIPISSIQHIEIVKGSNSVLYGTNAMNAVINIITRDQQIKGNNLVHYGARTQIGDYNSLATNFYLISKKNDIKFSLYSDMFSKKGERLNYVDEHGRTLSYNRSYLGINASLSLSYRNFRFDFLTYRRAEPVVRTRGFATIYLSVDDTIGTPVPEVNDEQMFIANLAYNTQVFGRFNIHAQSELLKWDNVKYLPDGKWYYYSFGNFNSLEINVLHNKKISNLLGFSLNNYIGRRFKTQINDYDIGKDNIFTHEFSAYYNGSVNIASILSLHYGVRYLLSKYKRTFWDLSPRLAAVLRIAPSAAVKLIYGQSFRVPTYFEKEVHSDKLIGNPYLKPEKSISYDLVFARAQSHVQYNVDFFYEQVKNQIERVVAPDDPDKRINLNVGTNTYKGIEISSIVNFDRVYCFAGYSYTLGNNDNTGQSLEFTYRHMLSGGLIYEPLPRIELKAAYKYLSGWGIAPAYNLVNLAMSLKAKLLPLELELRVNNVLNTKVFLPEIARDNNIIPKTEHRIFSVTLSYRIF